MVRRNRVRGLVGSAVLALSLTGLAGCGSGSAGAEGTGPARYTSAEALSAAVVAAIRAEGSYLTHMTQSTDPLVVDTAMTLTADGPAYAVTVSTRDQVDSLVSVDGSYYLRSATVDTEATRWTQVPSGSVTSNPRVASFALEADWATRFDALRLAKSFDASAPKEVDGESITIYTLVVDNAALPKMLRLDLLPEDKRAALVQSLQGQSAVLVVNLGDDDLPRKVVWSYRASDSLTVDTHYGFSEWGKTHVVAPPAELIDKS
jgi:hypothetical protein